MKRIKTWPRVLTVRALTLALAAAGCAHATVYQLSDPNAQVFGEDLHIRTHYSDTLVDIARNYGLGYEEMVRANPGVDPWLPGEGTPIVIPGRRILPPGPRDGIVVNLPEHRLYYYPKLKRGEKPYVITYPVSVGKMDWHTPLGQTYITQKIRNPVWIPPQSVRQEHLTNGDPLPAVVKAGPDNPLGLFALRMAVHPGDYLIHGTNNPLAVGMPVTHGCLRLYPEDIAALFPKVPVGTKVYLIDEPIKVAFVDRQLLLEVHPPIDDQGQSIEPVLATFEQMLNQALGNTTTAVNWDYAVQVLKKANGIPAVVGLQADLDQPVQAAQPADAPDSRQQAPGETGAKPAPAPAAVPASAQATASARP
ncbi:MAG TPA: L,D-transpeptidase family protein [Steroidobacteraceae bacterium]|nr:L,D-transpeptidase family protein [Steroidobacteraceae bacterium]